MITEEKNLCLSVMTIRILIRSEPLIFGMPDPGLFSSDPDPTCINRYIKILKIFEHNKARINKFKFKMMFYKLDPDPIL